MRHGLPPVGDPHPPKRLATATPSIAKSLDSEGSDGPQLASTIPPAGVTLKHFVDIDWPAGLAPTPTGKPSGTALPAADVLVVTWTVDEAHALSRVLTPGLDIQTDWLPNTENYSAIAADMRRGCPATEYKRLGLYWQTKIGSRSVTVVKSDSHMSQDGNYLTLWCGPK